MKKNNLIILIILIPAASAICTDSDGGPTNLDEPKDYIAKAGTATVAMSSSKDYCITGIDGAKTDRSAYIREFYCVGGKAQSKDYKCADYKTGVCVTAAGSSYCTRDSTEVAPDVCGDKKIKKPEECDPPDSICVDEDGWPGICSKTCTCMPYKKPKIVEAANQTENITTGTAANETINATINVTITNETVINKTVHVNKTIEIEKIEKIVEQTATKFEPVKPIAFNESRGIKIAYKVASFGHAVWNYIKDLW